MSTMAEPGRAAPRERINAAEAAAVADTLPPSSTARRIVPATARAVVDAHPQRSAARA